MKWAEDSALQLFLRFQKEGTAFIQYLHEQRAQETEILDFKEKSSEALIPKTVKRTAKADFDPEDHKVLAKSVSGFANTHGGVIVWGITCRKEANDADRVRAVPGVKNPEKFLGDIRSRLAQLTTPPVTSIEFLIIPKVISDEPDGTPHTVAADSPKPGYVVMFVPKAKWSQYPVKSEAASAGGYFQRTGSSFTSTPPEWEKTARRNRTIDAVSDFLAELNPFRMSGKRNFLLKSKVMDTVERFCIDTHNNWTEKLKGLPINIEQLYDAIDDPLGITDSVTQTRVLPSDATVASEFQSLDSELSRSLVILGDQGTGKTTGLLDLEQRLVKDARFRSDASMPIMLRLSTWNPKYQKLQDWILNEFDSVYDIRKHIAKKWLNEGKLVLLLDGLDELRREDWRPICVRAINKFISETETIDVVVTCRSENYRKLGAKLRCQKAIAIKPLSQEQLLDFVYRNEFLKPFAKNIASNSSCFQDFLTKPLMLKLVTNYAKSQPDKLQRMLVQEKWCEHFLPEYIDLVLGGSFATSKEGSGRLSAPPYDLKKTKNYLSKLAFQMQCTSQKMSLFEISSIQPVYLSRRWLVLYFLPLLPIVFCGFINNSDYSGMGPQEVLGTALPWCYLWLFFLRGCYSIEPVDSIGVNWFAIREYYWQLRHPIAALSKNRIFCALIAISFSFGIITYPSHVKAELHDHGLFEQRHPETGWLPNEITQQVRDNMDSPDNRHKVIPDSIFQYGILGPLAIFFFINPLILLPVWLRGQSIKGGTKPNQRIWNSLRSGLVWVLIFFVVGFIYCVLCDKMMTDMLTDGGRTDISFQFPERIAAANKSLRDLAVQYLIISPLMAFAFTGGGAFVLHFWLRFLLLLSQALPWSLPKFCRYAADRGLMVNDGAAYMFFHPLIEDHFSQLHRNN